MPSNKELLEELTIGKLNNWPIYSALFVENDREDLAYAVQWASKNFKYPYISVEASHYMLQRESPAPSTLIDRYTRYWWFRSGIPRSTFTFNGYWDCHTLPFNLTTSMPKFINFRKIVEAKYTTLEEAWQALAIALHRTKEMVSIG